jgi:hypothetical protein
MDVRIRRFPVSNRQRGSRTAVSSHPRTLPNEFALIRVHLSSQRCHLIGIAGVLEQHEIMRIEVHRSNVAISIKQILGYKHDRNVAMMGQFREEITHILVSFVHQIVYD